MAGRINATKVGQYRSKLEAGVGENLEGCGADFEYEPLYIPFSRPKHYQPDFILANGIVIEVKGYFKSSDRSKHLLVRDQYPDLDVRFVFARSNNRLSKRSKTTYAQWCETKGFEYADTTVPLAWIKEDPNPDNLATLEHLRSLPKNN